MSKAVTLPEVGGLKLPADALTKVLDPFESESLRMAAEEKEIAEREKETTEAAVRLKKETERKEKEEKEKREKEEKEREEKEKREREEKEKKRKRGEKEER